jgi:hypothetical protein
MGHGSGVSPIIPATPDLSLAWFSENQNWSSFVKAVCR